jgi:hypothetical protein
MRSSVGIVVARSSSYWDQWENTGRSATGTCLGGCTSSLLARSDAIDGEVFALWWMLTSSNIPVDFLSEDTLTNNTQLDAYSVLFITEPNLPSTSM